LSNMLRPGTSPTPPTTTLPTSPSAWQSTTFSTRVQRIAFLRARLRLSLPKGANMEVTRIEGIIRRGAEARPGAACRAP